MKTDLIVLKEVIYPKYEDTINYENKKCPNCKQKKLVHGPIPCPENRPGCLVMHYGYHCHNCGKIFN